MEGEDQKYRPVLGKRQMTFGENYLTSALDYEFVVCSHILWVHSAP